MRLRWVLLIASLAGAVILALAAGAPSSEVLWSLRVPRVLLGLGVGLGLGLAGTLLQAAFSNPLCEPYTLGISSGAALGVALGASLGMEGGVVGVGGGSVAGAMAFAILIQTLASRRTAEPGTILVTGSILGLAGASVVTVWMSLVEPQTAQDSLWWLLGDLSRARLPSAAAIIGISLSGLMLSLTSSRDLDALLLGDTNARAFGFSPDRARSRAVFVSSMVVGACVSAAGVIGFVGLVTPHLARSVFRSALHRRILPAAMLLGATMVVFSDGLARAMVGTYEVPVGAVTAILGAPFAIWTLIARPSTS